MCTVMDSFLKRVFIKAAKHMTVQAVHPHINAIYMVNNLIRHPYTPLLDVGLGLLIMSVISVTGIN